MNPLDLLDAVPHLVVRAGVIEHVSGEVAAELDCEVGALVGRLDEIGHHLDDDDFDDLMTGRSSIRVRLGESLADRPAQLRRLGVDGDRTWIEIRSLANEFRAEALLRRSGLGHMLISPNSWVHWSMASDELLEVMPGDDPIKWVELMDADDMQAIMLAVHDVANDPNLRRTLTHRLVGDDEHIVVDTIESVVFDPDLRAVLMRSRLERVVDDPIDQDGTRAPWPGISVSDHMPIGVLVASRDGRVLHRNAVAAELLNVRSGQMLVPVGDGPCVVAELEAEDRASVVAMVAAAADGQPGHCTVPSPRSVDRWLRISGSPSTATTIVVTIEDVTELTETERALRASNRLLEALDAHSEDLVMVFDLDGASRYASSSILRHLGAEAEVGHAQDVMRYVHPPDRTLVSDLIDRVRSQPGIVEEIEFRIDVEGVGNARWHHATITNLLEDPDVNGVVLTLRDVHERHVVERELRFRATHDALTTLPDRAALQARLEAMLRDAQRDQKPVALMFCDIDHFKSINDRAGHHVGDQVLTEVAERLRSSLRSSDVVGRFGGDEFVVVVPDVDDEPHAFAVAQRIFDTVTGPVESEVGTIEIAVSMGVAVSDEECATASALLQRADLAMYEAKAQGRGRFSMFSPSTDGAGSERDTLRADLEDAIVQRQLSAHYQPIVPLRDGLAPGVEAFVRWEHPALGLIEARRFVGIAEGAGLIGGLGEALVELVGANLSARADRSDDFVSINLSPAQIAAADAPETTLDQIERAGLPPERVAVEVTEAAFAQDPRVRLHLDGLRKSGVRVFLDDFGIGYSSLGHLRRFPVDGLKIDAGVINPQVDERLVSLIVSVASAMDVRTIAEGVETDEQLELIRQLGVDFAQGYLLGRPTPMSPVGSGVGVLDG